MAIGEGGGQCFRAIEQDGDNRGAIHIDLGSYADAVFAKKSIRYATHGRGSLGNARCNVTRGRAIIRDQGS